MVGRPALVALVSLAATAMPALAETVVTQVEDHEELNEKWCAASRDDDQIFVLPASLFVDSRELFCDDVPYKLYRIIESDDPSDFEYYLEPPFGKQGLMGCDGKAGREMKVIAVNCGPV